MASSTVPAAPRPSASTTRITSAVGIANNRAWLPGVIGVDRFCTSTSPVSRR